MQSLHLSAPEGEAQAAAQRLCGRPVRELVRAGRGGNNRIYRAQCSDGTSFALKSYPAQATDPRDRLGTEFAALRFLRHQGVGNVPAAIAAAPEAGFALYEWIDGEPVTRANESDADQALAFVSELMRLRAAGAANALPLASEACLSLEEICRQIIRRVARLDEVARSSPELADFLDDLRDIFGRARERARAGFSRLGLRPDQPLPSEARTLSPSDFGFHNALRGRDGRLVFVDFEYFGWDEPVKLVADFQLHPGMDLPPAMAARFREGALRIFESDRTLAERLRQTFPLYGLRWCAILLNEFLPERWYRRSFAQGETDPQAARKQQLGKAKARLEAVRREIDQE
jgi:hypothetical protein